MLWVRIIIIIVITDDNPLIISQLTKSNNPKTIPGWCPKLSCNV